MKKISAILLVILCVLALSSCASVGYEKAPSWLRGKTWTGSSSSTFEGEELIQDHSFTFYNDGEFRFEDYLGYLPEDMIITASGNSNTYLVSFVGPYVQDGISFYLDITFGFKKVSNNECIFEIVSKVAVAGDSAMETNLALDASLMVLSGTLYAN